MMTLSKEEEEKKETYVQLMRRKAAALENFSGVDEEFEDWLDDIDRVALPEDITTTPLPVYEKKGRVYHTVAPSPIPKEKLAEVDALNKRCRMEAYVEYAKSRGYSQRHIDRVLKRMEREND